MAHRYRQTKPYRKDKPDGPLRVVLYLDDETWAAADRMARKNDCTVSSQLAVLVEVGLEQLEAEAAAATRICGVCGARGEADHLGYCSQSW